MYELCQRFPLMAQKIMNRVDDETLISFKDAGRNNHEFLRKERFYWIRIIKRYSCLFGELQEIWKKVVRKTPIEIIKELAVAVHEFPQTMLRQHKLEMLYGLPMTLLEFVQKREKQWHPLVISAACGSVNLCNHIIQKVGVKHPSLSKRCGKNTPLAVAAEYMRDLCVFEFLLEKAEDKNPILIKPSNWTLLHDLAYDGHLEMCALMMEKVDDKIPQTVDGSTPFCMAAFRGHVEVCRLLMKYFTDKNPLDRGLLNAAASCGQLDVCNLLMENCVDKNDIDDCVRIPLHAAAFSGYEKIVGLFMANIVDKNLRDNEGRTFSTPLLTAIKGENLNVCKLLIEDYKVDVNIPDHSGMTPLHLASKMGQLEICKLLCKYMPDKNTLDSDGKTPLDLAVSVRKWNIVSFLKNSKNPIKNYKIN